MFRALFNFLATKILRIRNSFFAVFLLIQLLVALITYFFHQNSIDLINEAELFKIQSTIKYVNNRLEQGASSAQTAVMPIAQNEHFARLIAEHDRDKLAKAVEPTWAELAPLGISVLEFYAPDKASQSWTHFYRAHNPARFGDPITYKPVVSFVVEKKLSAHGLEQGKSGYSFRAAAPIYYRGAFVGVVTVGFDVGNAFLAILENAYPGNWGIYNLLRGTKSIDDRILVNATGPQKDMFFENLLPSEQVMTQILADKTYFETDETHAVDLIYIPVKNFQKDIALVIKYVSHTEFYANLAHARNIALIVGIIGFLLSSIFIFILYKLITTPIKQLVVETEKIKHFELDDPILVRSSLSELEELIGAMASMKAGLQSFRKYTPDELVRQLILNKQAAEVSGERRNLTIFFADIVGFTTIAEQLTPNELASQLSEYLSAMTAVIIKHGGTIDKYIGDAIMAFWGAPLPMDDHANKACLAALACRKAVKELNEKWRKENKPTLAIRVGIDTGETIVGNFGSKQRLSYSVMGDAVNIASRLEELNREYNTGILIAQPTLKELPDDYAYRLVDIVVVKGKTQPVPIFELVATKEDITSKDAEFLQLFNEAIHFYLKKDWSRAKMRFTKLLQFKPDDQACKIFIKRCTEYEVTPPSDDWAGEYVYTHK